MTCQISCVWPFLPVGYLPISLQTFIHPSSISSFPCIHMHCIYVLVATSTITSRLRDLHPSKLPALVVFKGAIRFAGVLFSRIFGQLYRLGGLGPTDLDCRLAILKITSAVLLFCWKLTMRLFFLSIFLMAILKSLFLMMSSGSRTEPRRYMYMSTK